MKNLDFYEFTGVFLPGALFLLGLSFEYPEVKSVLFAPGFLPAAGFLILSYAAGHLVQVIGNFWENIWWRIRGGWPTDWMISKPELYPDRWRKVVFKKMNEGKEPTLKEWKDMVRELYADLSSSGRIGRIDIFNGNYGMFRGFCAAILSIVLVNVFYGFPSVSYLYVYFVLIVTATYRMDRFAKNYAKEIFAQYSSMFGKDQQTKGNL